MAPLTIQLSGDERPAYHPSSSLMPSLDDRLAAAGVTPGAAPLAAWLGLRVAEGRRATIIDLYELAARERGVPVDQLSRAERDELSTIAMPVIWPGFTRTSGSERGDVLVEVVAYEETWPERYEWWRERLAGALGVTALNVQHVGSTSVPGLAAKPTVDIQISVADLADESGYVASIERAGVQLRSRDDQHRFFRPYEGQPRDVHVHVCTAGSDWEREHLLFRDYLRAHPAARDAYAEVKWQAARFWLDDRIAYTEAKSAIILDLLDAAEAWAAERSWTVRG